MRVACGTQISFRFFHSVLAKTEKIVLGSHSFALQTPHNTMKRTSIPRNINLKKFFRFFLQETQNWIKIINFLLISPTEFLFHFREFRVSAIRKKHLIKSGLN